MNKFFAFASSAIGILALGGAIFENATNHYATAGLCFIITIVCIADNKENNTPKRTGR